MVHRRSSKRGKQGTDMELMGHGRGEKGNPSSAVAMAGPSLICRFVGDHAPGRKNLHAHSGTLVLRQERRSAGMLRAMT